MSDEEANPILDLLSKARQGDSQGRDELFRACRPYLSLLARSHVESWLQSKVDASDIVQQTMLEAHKDFARFGGNTEREWLAWLKNILNHNAADFVRRHTTGKREAKRERELNADQPRPPGAEPDPTPSQIIMRKESELALAAAIEQLPDDYRQVIVLRNLQHLPFEEVAERMNRSRPAAQMLWMRALRKLQEIVE